MDNDIDQSINKLIDKVNFKDNKLFWFSISLIIFSVLFYAFVDSVETAGIKENMVIFSVIFFILVVVFKVFK